MNSKQVTISQTSGCLGKQDEEYILVGFCQPDITRVTWQEGLSTKKFPRSDWPVAMSVRVSGLVSDGGGPAPTLHSYSM